MRYYMRELRIVFGLAAAVTFASLCAAQSEKKKDGQSRPDLSGTWILNKAKSDKTEYDVILTVAHSGPEIKVTQKFMKNGSESIQKCAYYTDGRAEKESESGCRNSESLAARWQGRKLVRRSRSTTKGLMKIEMVVTEEWELSKDGKTLTRTITSAEALSLNQTMTPRFQTRYVFTRSS